MRKLTLLLFCSTVAVLGLGLRPDARAAGFVSPVLPPDDAPPPAQIRLRATGVPPPVSLIQAVTSTADGGPGSLRQAIADAAPGDTIVFSFALPAVLSLTNRLVINKDLTVLGPDPAQLTIQRSEAPGTPDFRVLQIQSGSTVSLSGLTIRNGRVFPPAVGDLVGGGIYNLGSLTVSNCVIADNVAPTATVGSGRGFGGGIFSFGSLAIYNSSIHDNVASFAGGGVYAFFTPALLASGCTVVHNQVGDPGNPPTVEGQGGGINCQGTTSALIHNCTVSGNTVYGLGGGGGVLNLSFGAEPSALTVESSTITGNSGQFNGGIASVSFSGGGPVVTSLRNTLVAQNAGPDFTITPPAVFVSLGHNLDSDGSSGFTHGVNGDIVGSAGSPVDARLGPLKDDGGLTATHALAPDSPAVDAGDNASPPSTDQRGLPRIVHGQMDIGAFELQLEAPTIVCPGNVTTNTAPGLGSQIVSFGPLVATGFPVPDVVCSAASGTSFALGTTVVTCTASNVVGLATCTFSIRVNARPVANLLQPTNLTTFVVTQPIALLADAFDPDGSVTRVEFFEGANLLATVSNSPYAFTWINAAAGLYQLTAVATDNLGATGTSAVANVTVLAHLPVPFVSTVDTNSLRVRQTGLFFQTVRVSNPTPLLLAAVQLTLSNLPPVVQVWNATGTNAGLPFLLHNEPVPAGGSVDFEIEYLVSDFRTVPSPTLIADLVPTAPSPPVAGAEIVIVRQGWWPPSPANPLDRMFLVEFQTQAGRTYYVQYSDSLPTWRTVLPAIQGNGTTVQWLDSGPPKTARPPAEVVSRAYRVIQL